MIHTLNSLFLNLVEVESEAKVLGLTLDSREAGQGYIYFAVQGASCHGIDYLSEVLNAGVIAVVVDENDAKVTDEILQACQQNDVVLIKLCCMNEKMGDLAAKYYGNNFNDLTIIGVTGTDGKTSVTQFIAQALRSIGKVCAVMGTNGWGMLDQLKQSKLTTPDVIEVHRQLNEIHEMGAKYVCMEVSSHALDQGRVCGVGFTQAVLTNIARDHLDYHGTLENYANAKSKLFDIDTLEACIVNADDSLGAKLVARLIQQKVVSYSMKEQSTVMASMVECSAKGLLFDLSVDNISVRVQSQLLGHFNVYNLLAVFSVLRELDVSLEDTISAIETVTAVDGRMERVSVIGAPLVVVDFAHTPQALEQALKSIKQYCNGKVISVFGCGGDRDTGKRALMGEISSRLADITFITNDNPRTESPELIAEHIMQGVTSDSKVEILLDREQAILNAIASAQIEDCIVIAGKGHERYQITGNVKSVFSDKLIVEKGLKRWVA